MTTLPASRDDPSTMLEGTETTGGAGRLTVTVKVPVAVPNVFVTEQVTVFTPMAKVDPDAGLQDGVPSVEVAGG